MYLGKTNKANGKRTAKLAIEDIYLYLHLYVPSIPLYLSISPCLHRFPYLLFITIESKRLDFPIAPVFSSSVLPEFLELQGENWWQLVELYHNL